MHLSGSNCVLLSFYQSLMDQYFARMCSLMLSKELPARIRFLLQVRFLFFKQCPIRLSFSFGIVKHNICFFKLQDTVELREHHWVPRKAFLDNGPKTINQIRQDAVKVSFLF